MRKPSDAPSERTRLRRSADRAAYDAATLHAILDEALVCHVGFRRQGAPSIVPSAFVRWGDAIYLHGSTANRAFRTVASGEEVCVEVTLLDGIVLARSSFHHSLNYRSVVIYGRGSAVSDPEEKLEALRRTVEHVCPGRWADARPPSPEEFVRTLVVKIPIHEASAKIRRGGPIDEEADLALEHWAGVIPLRVAPGEPEPDGALRPGIAVPEYLRRWRRA